MSLRVVVSSPKCAVPYIFGIIAIKFVMNSLILAIFIGLVLEYEGSSGVEMKAFRSQAPLHECWMQAWPKHLIFEEDFLQIL